MIRTSAAAWVVVAAWSVASAPIAAVAAEPKAGEPKVEYLAPGAAQPGESIDLALRGSDLAQASGLWTNIPGAEARPVPLKKKDTEGKVSRWRLTVPRGTPLGSYGVRLATLGGISNLRLIAIDDLPTVNEAEDNKSRQTAQELSLPIAVEGTAEPESYDYFRFRAEAGQRVSVDVLARRLGSPMDPVIRLLDAEGKLERELAYSDDEEAIGADSRFVHRFAAAGNYLLELRDIRYQGGGEFRYRLRLGDFPLATAAFPLGVQRGVHSRLKVIGTDLASMPPLAVHVPADASASFVRLAASYSQGQGSAPLVVDCDRQPEQVELEPNNSLETASPIELVGAVSGRFDMPHDRDYFRFDAKQGERWLLTGRTRALGLPTDLYLRLYDSAGKQLIEVEDTSEEEGVIDYTIGADGSYRLMVEDLLNRGGAEQAYRVEFAPYRPGFSLTFETERVSVPKDGALAVSVIVARHNYKGPIELELRGADLPFVMAEAKSTPDKKSIRFVVPLTKSVAPGRHGICQIVGKAKVDGQDFSAVASNASALRSALAGLTTLPPDLDGWLAYGVGPVAPDFFELKPETMVIPYLQLVGRAQLKLKADRVGKFDEAIELAVEGLPPGLSAAAVTIAKGKNEAVIEFQGPRALAEGDYPLRLVGRAQFKDQPGKVVLDKLVLHVVRPLTIAAEVAGPLARGGQQKVRIRVRRAADDKPIELAWQGLPAAVRGEEKMLIPAGQHELVATMSAGADAQLGKLACRLLATTKVRDQTISVASDAIEVEVVGK